MKTHQRQKRKSKTIFHNKISYCPSLIWKKFSFSSNFLNFPILQPLHENYCHNVKLWQRMDETWHCRLFAENLNVYVYKPGWLQHSYQCVGDWKKKKDKIQVSWIITNCGFSFSLYSLFACFNGIFIMSLSFFASIALTHAQRYSRINKHRYAKRTRKKDYPFTFKVHNISLLVENCTVCISRVKGWNQ